MGYLANVVTVFIASPGDVVRERAIIREVIAEWNGINAMQRKIILQPLGWEQDSYPVLGDRPQALINDQVLKNADLLIGVFWTRIGTPTGGHESGTVEEIKEHIAAGKPAMIYISDQPVHPSKMDKDQAARLEDLKAWLKSHGLLESYESEIEFSKKCGRQLALLLNTHKFFESIRDAAGGPSAPAIGTAASSAVLSDDAKLLLKEISADPNGSMYKIWRMGGFYIQVNGKGLGSMEGDPKQRAALEAAIDELVGQGFVTPVGTKGETFQITRKGYELAETMR